MSSFWYISKQGAMRSFKTTLTGVHEGANMADARIGSNLYSTVSAEHKLSFGIKLKLILICHIEIGNRHSVIRCIPDAITC